jgi:type I restriction enzyme, S subunit
MWKTVKLGDICEFENGDRGKNYPSKKHQISEGIPFINAGDLTNDGEISTKGMAYISDERFNLLGAGKVRINDVLFCLRGSLGKCAINKVYSRGAIASSLVILRPDQNAIIPEYLLYLLKSVITSDLIVSTAGGAAQPNLSAKTVANYKYSLPPLAEQQRIVEKLDRAFEEIDRAIEATEHTVRMSSELYANAIKSIYFSDNDAKVVHLKDVAKIKGGKRIPKGKKLTTEITDYPYIRVSDFTEDGTVDVDSLQYITADIREQISNYTISSDDVYVSIAGTIGKTGVIPSSLNGANLTENAAKIVLDGKCLRDYFYFFTTSSSFEEQAIRHTRTAAQPKLALERLGKIMFPLHEIEKQKSIIDKVKEIRILVNEHKQSMRLKEQALRMLKSAILAQELKGPES